MIQDPRPHSLKVTHWTPHTSTWLADFKGLVSALKSYRPGTPIRSVTHFLVPMPRCEHTAV